MGWNTGNEVFDPVAKALIRENVPAEVRYRILSELAAALQRQDWDTEDESLEKFKDDPVIVRVFHEHGIRGYTDGKDGDWGDDDW